jgi:hypothetical protein
VSQSASDFEMAERMARGQSAVADEIPDRTDPVALAFWAVSYHPHVEDLVRQGRRVAAVKAVHDATGADLRSSRGAVDLVQHEILGHPRPGRQPNYRG